MQWAACHSHLPTFHLLFVYPPYFRLVHSQLLLRSVRRLPPPPLPQHEPALLLLSYSRYCRCCTICQERMALNLPVCPHRSNSSAIYVPRYVARVVFRDVESGHVTLVAAAPRDPPLHARNIQYTLTTLNSHMLCSCIHVHFLFFLLVSLPIPAYLRPPPTPFHPYLYPLLCLFIITTHTIKPRVRVHFCAPFSSNLLCNSKMFHRPYAHLMRLRVYESLSFAPLDICLLSLTV